MKLLKEIVKYGIILSLAVAPNYVSNSADIPKEQQKKRSEIYYKEMLNKENEKKYKEFIESVKNYEIPELKTYRGIGTENCSRYIRWNAKEIYGKNYAWGDSWNRIYNDSVVAKVDSGYNQLENMVKEGTLKPGMLVGIYYTGSSHKKEKDMKGKPIEITHVAIYQGPRLIQKPNGSYELELVFDHNWGPRQERFTTKSEWFEKKKDLLIPRYILDEKI